MNDFPDIRRYFRPIQPGVKGENGDIIYHESSPGKDLENFVYCFWQLKTSKGLDQPFVYRVVSDGCIDIFFNHYHPSENFVMGFCRKYTEFAIGTSFNYIGIRFLPSAFPLLFGVNAKMLSNKSQELKDFLPDLSMWIGSNVSSSDSFENIIGLLGSRILNIVRTLHFQFDRRFFDALELIFRKNGFLDTEKDLMTGLSPRHLRRIFNFYIGTTAKTFSNVVRFQYILNAISSKKSLREDKIYFDVGFFDQAHFIKNFKTFYGVSPSEAFR